jgi:putative membrane protein
MSPLFANTPTLEALGLNLVGAATFGLLGIALLALGFKVFELITPKLEVEKKLQEGNIAVGIVVGALLLAVGIVIAVAIA